MNFELWALAYCPHVHVVIVICNLLFAVKCRAVERLPADISWSAKRQMIIIIGSESPWHRLRLERNSQTDIQ